MNWQVFRGFTVDVANWNRFGTREVGCWVPHLLRWESDLVRSGRDNYVMRSTRHVVEPENDVMTGHYSDPPMLGACQPGRWPEAWTRDDRRHCASLRYPLGPGTLYGAIARLEQQGWIAPLPPQERRRPYRITPNGLRVLRARLTTLQQFTEAGLKRLEA